MLARLSGLGPGRLRLALVASALGVLATGYALVLKGPLSEYRSVHRARVALQESLVSGAADPAGAARLRQEAEELERRIRADGANLPPGGLEASVIGGLDEAARRTGVRLAGVSPGPRREVNSFRETLFSVEVVGNYRHSYAWLCELDRTLGPIAVKNLEAVPDSNLEDMRMKLTLASYRPAN